MVRRLLIAILALMPLAVVDARGGDTPRTITRMAHASSPNPIPIRTCGLTYRGRSIAFDAPFTESNDLWFDDLVICVRNTSGRVVKEVVLDLWLPHKADSSRVFGVQYKYVGPLAPNDIAQLRIDKKTEHLPPGYDASHLTLRIDGITFDDNEMWYEGMMLRYNVHQDAWIPTEQRKRPH